MTVLALCLSAMLASCGKEVPYHPAPAPDDDVQIEELQPIVLSGTAAGSYEYSDGTLKMTSKGQGSIYGVCLDKVCSGHFIAEAESDSDRNFGLAIVREENGRPDYDNYVAVTVCLEDGTPVIRARDRQNGKDNVLDNTGAIPESDMEFRYAIPLDGRYFSVPFRNSTGKVRIIRNSISGFFHLYVGVGKEIDGRFCEDWIETAQIKDWNGADTDFFICPVIRLETDKEDETVFSDIWFEEFGTGSGVPTVNGFAAEETSDLVWAGFPGDGVVVSFDERFCPASAGGRKFIFWSESNYVPAWLMSNELLYCYEFCETWSDNVKGCFEPMSDRLLAYADVEVTEDNDVRKTVRYSYALVNPDYAAPYPDGSFPEVVEWYTFYPDGVGVRRMDYIQNGTPNGRYHELSEPMVISGSSSVPEDHFKSPAFVISNLSGARYDLYPDKSAFDAVNANVPTWDEQIYRVRLNSAPDAFSVFSDPGKYPGSEALPVSLDLSWHDITYQMSHFPVDKQPYLLARYGDYDKSNATWPSQVSHSSLIGVEAKEGCDWTSDYLVDDEGRKYRAYLMLFGIAEADDSGSVDAHVRSWLSCGSLDNLSGVTVPEDVTGYDKREIVLRSTGDASCGFRFVPAGTVRNPVFRISGWTGGDVASLYCNDRELVAFSDYICDIVDGNLVIWMNIETGSPIEIRIN